VAGISKVGALKKTTEMVEFRSGGDQSTSQKLQGRTKYEAITLSAGVTHDTAFEEWANAVNNFQGDSSGSNKASRKDIIIDVFNENDQKVLSYKVFKCWVSEYQALPELDAGANAVMIQTIKLENEGWERDPAVVEPAEF
jgi:phage tail-like protein